ncbi:MAG: TonB-dependent receptor plug domain-containing protein, partial [Proteiniphilum sp.]
MNNISLRDFFSYIEKNYSYTFMYDNTDINDKQLISVNERNQPIEKVLASVLKDKGIRFEVQAFQIILSKANTIVSTENRQQARKNITGRILDEKGEPVIGANIVEKGTTNGTVTDVEGNFTLNVEENAAIHVSYIGYLPQDITSAGKNSLHVVLLEDMTTLDEIVVVGYGTMRKRDLTGSVSSIKSEDIQRSPVTSLDQAIQGKAAGVQVSQASSAPGGRVLIRVRGGNSLSSSNEPLYVVDGFPVSAGGSAGGNGTAQNPLATLNTADIASIEILKDASATAIYGARGANGVVLITTKRGEIGKPQVTLDVYHGVQTLAKKLDLMNAREYAT